MSVLEVVPVYGSNLSANRSLVHRFEEPFKVRTTLGTTPLEVLQHPDTPKPGDPHWLFPASFADDVFIEQDSKVPTLYRLDVPYSPLNPGEKRDLPDNPLERPAVIESNSIKETVTITRDIEGKVITNTAGDLLVGIQEEEVLWEFLVKKNIPPKFPKFLKNYARAMNKESVILRGQRYPKKTLKVDGLRLPDSQWLNGVEYIPMELRILYLERGWQRKLLNYGVREKKFIKTDSGELLEAGVGPILVGNPAKPTEQPIPLDADGRAFREERVTPNDIIEVVRTRVSQAEIEQNLIIRDTRPVLPFRKLPLR